MTTSSRIFDVVQSMSGQKNVLIIPRPYLEFFGDDQQAYQLAAVLNQLVFWSGCGSREDGWFYKTHEELGDEVALGKDQVRRIVTKLESKFLTGVLETASRRLNNGDKVKHYRLDGNKLIELIFPVQSDAYAPNGNGESAEPEKHYRHSETAKMPFDGNGEGAVPILYTDLNTDPDLQIIKDSCQPAAQTDRDVEITDLSKQVLTHLNTVTGSRYQVSKSSMENIRARLGEGFSLEDLQLVVDYSQAKWGNDIKMAEYLRPATLFQNSKFPGYLQAATKWHAAGRPENVNGQWVKAGETPVGDTTERDAAYRRYVSGTISPTKPSELEKRVCKAANAVNLRKQRPEFAMSRWNAIWKEQAQRGNKGEAA